MLKIIAHEIKILNLNGFEKALFRKRNAESGIEQFWKLSPFLFFSSKILFLPALLIPIFSAREIWY